MKKTVFTIMAAISMSLFFSGCVMVGGIWNSSEIEVRRAIVPVKVDGKVTDEIWSRSKYYPMVLPCDRLGDWFTNRPSQEGMVQVAYDDKFVYVLAKFVDDDIVQYGNDGDHLYSRGDLLEFFALDESTGRYWEIYGSANGKSTIMFFENGGKRIFPEAIQKDNKVNVAVTLDGTLNDSSDTDNGYVVEMAIPMSVFTSKGSTFKAGTKWKLLCARYNYSKSLYEIEYSVTSRMRKLNYHDRKCYLPVVFK